MTKDMLKSGAAQRVSESYESERFPQDTKEHGGGPYLSAPRILRLPPKPCKLRIMPRPKARDSAEAICGLQIDELKNYFPPEIDGQVAVV
jgi:hypothetical protein